MIPSRSTTSLTLNLGVRFDHNTGRFSRLRSPDGWRTVDFAGQFVTPTGETVPGVSRDLINWNLVSPRVGFACQPTGDGRSVIKGSFGVYYDQNVIGNWDAPPPGLPTFTGQILNPDTGEYETLYEITSEDIGFNPDLKAPRTLQYALGFEQQVSNEVALGIQYVYKTTKDLVGWEILGGTYEEVPFTDPFTNTQYTMLSAIELPVIRKGNRPGSFPGGEDLEYFQNYHGVAFTFDKRFSQNWSLGGSYTWSRSEGRIPRMLAQTQFNPFYGSSEGSDPNQWLNTDSLLQGDRPHMFRAQGVYRFPYEIQIAASAEFSSGRAHSRQIRVGGLAQGGIDVIMEPIGAYRYSPIKNIDLSIGKRIYISDQAFFRLEGWIFNLLNSDQELFFSTLRLQSAGDEFTPDTWMKPRRLQIRAGFYF